MLQEHRLPKGFVQRSSAPLKLRCKNSGENPRWARRPQARVPFALVARFERHRFRTIIARGKKSEISALNSARAERGAHSRLTRGGDTGDFSKSGATQLLDSFRNVRFYLALSGNRAGGFC